MTMEAEQEVAEYTAQHAVEKLAQDPRTSELEVRVSIVGRKVFLHGAVTSDDRRDAITQVAGECLPDFEIHNEISLIDLRPAEETERLT
jgi:hypothetical protein